MNTRLHTAPLDLVPDLRCPYCHDAIDPADLKRPCLACMAWHHAACFDEHPRCAACDASVEDDPEPRPRRRRSTAKAQGKLQAPRRTVRLVDAVRPSRTQLAKRYLGVVAVALVVSSLGRRVSLPAVLAILGPIVAFFWFVTYERTRSAPPPAPSVEPRRGSRRRRARFPTPATCRVRAALGFVAGSLIAWCGLQLLTWLVALPGRWEDRPVWLHHPALQEVLLGGALLFGLAVARFVYRD
ncbi:MAG: hypothetical protein R3F62_10965 [Planctomycetota bacterium]